MADFIEVVSFGVFLWGFKLFFNYGSGQLPGKNSSSLDLYFKNVFNFSFLVAAYHHISSFSFLGDWEIKVFSKNK